MNRPEEAPACPRCQSSEIVPIGYGYPSPDGTADRRKGRIVSAGCSMGLGTPICHCTRCGHRFGSVPLPTEVEATPS